MKLKLLPLASLVLLGAFGLVGCASEAPPAATTSLAAEPQAPAAPTSQTQTTASPASQVPALGAATAKGPAVSLPARGCVHPRVQPPWWELDSLAAFDTLLSQADGYIYYYTFADPPPGLEAIRVGLPTHMDGYNITFRNPKNQLIQLFVFVRTPKLRAERDAQPLL